MGKRRTVLLLGLAVLALAGCGYSTHSLYRDDIKTIYVQFFDNETFRRQLEVGLTKDVVNEIKLRTPLIFAPRAEADSELSGTITVSEVSTQVKQTKDLVVLQRARLEVRFRWRDRLTGRNIVPEQVISDTSRVPVMFVNGVFQDSPEQTALFDLALREAARRIVENMEQSW